MKVLIVDDDPHLRKLYKEELEDEHYDVYIASSGKEALEIFARELPDIVTLDILMPGMDGIEVLRRMKEQKPNLPVIMSTAYDYRDDFSVWASDAYVVKSADMTELKNTIKNLLSKK
ncbi:MAG: response regulator [Nitrospirae bacterium]|uniref:response regulator n=1 Tax=Candidatus Magnetominusculus dajiuhuensis TaxID=3137712 RepID=UPI0019DA2DA1|nr:response regulator [Nitrospirota bacterium]MBF0567534.1 response regulator [Nitrospirota bacterium]